MDSSIFVQNIKKYCDRKGVKPTPACRDAGVSSSFISNIERGAMPSIDKVQMLASYLGVTTSDLLGEETQQGEEDKINPEYQELRALIDCATDTELRTLLDLIKLTKILKANKTEGRKKENSLAQGEAVEGEKEPVFEAGKPVDHGTYRCVGCKKDFITIYDDGTALRPCAVCGEIYWSKIK